MLDGMAALGKQVGTYLRGRTAEEFERLREDRRTTVYQLLTEAVEVLLDKEGYLEKKVKQKLSLDHRKLAPSAFPAEASREPTVREKRMARRRRMAK